MRPESTRLALAAVGGAVRAAPTLLPGREDSSATGRSHEICGAGPRIGRPRRHCAAHAEVDEQLPAPPTPSARLSRRCAFASGSG